jgi:DNA anti-recombination protein RmuC
MLHSAEGSLVEARSQNNKLREELDEARTILNENSQHFDHETKELKAKVEAEAERNTKLHEAIKNLRNKCSDFATRCISRLKGIFYSVGATSEEINLSHPSFWAPRPGHEHNHPVCWDQVSHI